MAQLHVYEGTLDEITVRYGMELGGRRLRVVALDETFGESPGAKPFYETATAAQWEEALRAWATNHDPHTPLLSEEDIARDSIYEGRCE